MSNFSSRSKFVLLVDDSKAAQKLLHDGLTGLEYNVLLANSAKDALVILKSNPNIDCILSDYEMPEMTGLELALEVKSHSELRNIPFIILTGKESNEYLLQAIDAGADDFVSKSFSIAILDSKIKAMIRLKEMSLAAQTASRLIALRQMIATYNHEFNNPLAIAIGKVGIMKKTAPVDQIKSLESIEAQLNRISELVKKIEAENNFEETHYGDYSKIFKVA